MSDSENSPPQILPSDLELIDSFIRGKKKSIAAAHLQIEYVANTVKLLDRQKNVVGVSKQVNEWQQKVLLQRHSPYIGAIQEQLRHSGFFTIATSGHPDFLEYHKYQTPSGFRLYYQSANALGQSWLNYHAQSAHKHGNTLLIFQDNNWYPIQELNLYQQTMRLRTLVGEKTLNTEDLIVWIEQMPATPETMVPSEAPNPRPEPVVSPLSPPITNTNTMSTVSEDVSKSTELTAVFKTPVVTSGYKAANEQLDSLKNAIRVRALAKLVDYLDEGEKIVSTEVLKNGHDQVISTKTTEIKRNCPRWVIEQIKKF